MTTEFVKQTMRENISRTLIPHIADGLWSIYDSAKQACERNKQVDQTIRVFQNLLTQIPKWTEPTIDAEVDRISVASKCDYIDDLLMGVFVSYIRAFATLQQVETTHVEIPFTKPSLGKFIHLVYISAARKSWTNAFLFKTIGVTSEQQARNRRDIETMLVECLHEVIDSCIPWKEISKAYFAPPVPKPTAVVPEVIPPLPIVQPKATFAEEADVLEYETEDEDDDTDASELSPIALGEDTKLDGMSTDDEEDDRSISADAEGTVELNV